MTTGTSALAGQAASASILIDVSKLVSAYHADLPDPTIAAQRVAFGTSGHRGSAFDRSFNEWHVLTITQAICHYGKAPMASAGRCSWASTHMRCRRLRAPVRWKCSRPMASL